MKKKLIVMWIAIIMVFSVFGFFGCRYNYQEGDFRLTVIAHGTELRVGDTIKITVRFENLSGRRLRIVHGIHNLEIDPSILGVDIFLEDGEPLFAHLQPAIYSIIERNEIIEAAYTWKAEKIGKFYVQAVADFGILGNQTRIGHESERSYKNQTHIWILSEKFEINVFQ